MTTISIIVKTIINIVFAPLVSNIVWVQNYNFMQWYVRVNCYIITFVKHGQYSFNIYKVL